MIIIPLCFKFNPKPALSLIMTFALKLTLKFNYIIPLITTSLIKPNHPIEISIIPKMTKNQ